MHHRSLTLVGSLDAQLEPKEVTSIGFDTRSLRLEEPLESFGADEIDILATKWIAYPSLCRSGDHTMLAIQFIARKDGESFVASDHEQTLAHRHGRRADTYFLVTAPECRPYIVGQNAFNWEIDQAPRYELTDSDAGNFREAYFGLSPQVVFEKPGVIVFSGSNE